MNDARAFPVDETERRLVSIEKIDNINSIPGANAIEAVNVKGWTVVTKIGEFKVGDLCLYFEIDSLLPLSDPRFAFLRERGAREIGEREYHLLKTARLRGVYSQGLVLPLNHFPEIREGQEKIASTLKILKYEVPAITSKGDIVGRFPIELGRKTGSDRAQNLAYDWEKILRNGPWVATEKIDGSSISVFRDSNGRLLVCSHNFEVSQESSVYGQAVKECGIDTWLKPGWGVQGEVFGEGVQKNPLGILGRKIAIFDVWCKGEVLSYEDWPVEAQELRVPILDLELPLTVQEAVEQVDKIKSAIAPGRSAEGVVWHQARGVALKCLNYRSTFKVISNSYLMKHE